MATDLFGQYYNNPTKSYIYANLLCNGASADEISFNMAKHEGVISNNENSLSTIDFSSIHVPLAQYTRDMKIINPYGFIYIRGIDYGDSYTTKAYGLVLKRSISIEDWMYITTAIVHIKYVDEQGHKVLKCIVASGSVQNDITFIDELQNIFNEKKIPITVTYKDQYLYFTSTTLGYEFWLTDIELWHYLGDGSLEEDFPELFENADPGTSNDLGFGYDDNWIESTGAYDRSINTDTVNAYTTPVSETDYRKIYDILGQNIVLDASTEEYQIYDVSTNVLFNEYLFEDLTKYIPAHKYRNGAMKGCVVVATYPIYNASNIQETQRALKIGHLKDRVEEFYTSRENTYTKLPMYVRVVRDVVDAYFSQYEYDAYNRWSNAYTYMNTNDGWIDPEEIPLVPYDDLSSDASAWWHSHVPNYYMLNSVYKDAAMYDVIGLYGYASYLSKHNEWQTMGQLYARTSVGDDEATNTHNLIPSFLIYNPNNFPVTINYMTFA